MLLLKFALSFLIINISNAATLQKKNASPVADNQNSLSIGEYGQAPVLLQDSHLIEKISHLDRERIPERVVHARGTGAFGFFKATKNLEEITRAVPFASEDKKTKVFVRFSTVIHGNHSPETLRDPRGFAVKFYTEEGNWDLVGNNLPVFFIRDAMKFPDLVHSLKPNPVTNLQEGKRFFDFFAKTPESTHMFTRLFSPFGVPASYRKMEGSSVHAYKFVNKDCQANYVKFTFKPREGVKNLTMKQIADIQKDDFNNLTKDLYENIKNKNYPIWDLYIQIINPDDKEKFDFNILDATKIWSEDLVPMQKIGELTLNEIPGNFFQNTEQSAFAPSNMIPGIEPSEDRLLQGRLFSYADTQNYRLGINHNYLPINAPLAKKIITNNQDGAGYSPPRKDEINYEPSSYNDIKDDNEYGFCHYQINGLVNQGRLTAKNEHNFKQAGMFYKSLSKDDKAYLIKALTKELENVDINIKNTICAFCYKADIDYGIRVAKQLKLDIEYVKKIAKKYID